ncbi:hypothetical protein KVT40_003855 [Elsinoe batatas]|uniref:N-acetyltransferase domain-containing protein n=1 Tax=Elsinoe batatas TaxID=2601811 RepID=A0A8K0L2N0_9PEZI|nr:hypothetical protein KVT40_003855 [Elsinoe batatas]
MSHTLSPNHSLLPTHRFDTPLLGQFLSASKLQLAINRFIFKSWPHSEKQLAHYTAQVESAYGDSQIASFKVVHDRSGEVVAHLVLTREEARGGGEGDADERNRDEGKGEEGDGKEGRPDVPEYLVPEPFFAVIDAAEEIEKEVEGRERLTLTWMYVRPESRRQGIGSGLVAFALETARKEGVPLVTAAEPQAYDFMKKRGFRDTKHVDFDLAKWAPSNSGYGVFRLSGLIAE